jgi:hypothetical protein
MSLSTVAGYTITFIKNDRVKQFTFASSDDLDIENRLRRHFGDIQIVKRRGVPTPIGEPSY